MSRLRFTASAVRNPDVASVWFQVFCGLLAVCLLFPVVGAAQSTPPPVSTTDDTLLHRELTEVSQHLQHRLRRAASLRDRSQVSTLEGEAMQLRQRLTALAEAAARAGSPALRQKMRQLERQLHNFELALGTSEVPPRLLAPVHGVPQTLDRGGNATEGGAPANDACEAAPVIELGTVFGDTTAATQDGQATCGASLATPDVWFELVPSQSGQVWVDTLGSGYDTVLSLHSACPGTIANELRCNDDALGLDSSVNFFAIAGQPVWIRVSGYDGATGPLQLNIGQGGSVEGTVVEADTAIPLSQGQVCLYRTSGFALACSTLGPDGTYALTDEDPGTYYAVATSDQHIDELYDDAPCPQGFDEPGCEPEDGAPIALGSLDRVTVDFALSRGGSLQGIVLDDGSNLPIDFATVRIRPLGNSAWVQTQTDAAGVYRFDGLTTGTYEVYTVTSTHQDELWDDIPCFGEVYSEACPIGTGSPIAITEGSTVSGIDFRLVRQGTITGRVTQSTTGDPLFSADVDLYHVEGERFYTASANSNGEYSRSDLPAGTYHAAARDLFHGPKLWDDIPCNGGCDLTEGTDILVELDATTSGIDFALDPLGEIRGEVVRAIDGSPAGNGRVEIYDDFGFVASTSLFGSGDYLIWRLLPGTYYALATSTRFNDELFEDIACEGGCDPTTGTPIVVAPGASVTVDFTVDIGGEIRGTVTDQVTGGSVSEAVIEVWDHTGQRIASGISSFSDGTFAIEVPLGTFTVSAKATGRYLAQLYDDLDCQGEVGTDCDPTLGTAVVANGNTLLTGIDFALRRGAGVSGRVTSAQSGNGLDYLTVALRRSNGTFVASALTNSSGDFGLFGLEPDTYIATVSPNFDYVAQMYDGLDCAGSFFTCDLGLATPIVVPADTVVSGIDFALQARGSITGTVLRSADGSPVSGATLRAYRVADQGFEELDFSNFDGTYRVSDLSAGDYYLLATSDNLASEIFDDVPCNSLSSCDLSLATRVSVAIGGTTPDIDFVLDSLGSVSGVVRDEAGLPISGVEVSAWLPGGGFASDHTDSSGIYHISRLRAGTVYLATDNSWGYLDESYDDIPCFSGPLSGCDPLKGDPVTVVAGLETRHVDFELQAFNRGVLGTVVDGDGTPLLGVLLDVWDGAGNHVTSTPSGVNGSFFIPLLEGTYTISTDNGQGLVDELFDNLSCPGSAYAGGCDPTTGTPLTVGPTGSDTAVISGVDFELQEPEAPFFSDGFESGDLSAWSSSVGGTP